MPERQVLIEKEDAICILSMNRPGRLNALSLEIAQELQEHFDQIALDGQIRVIILEGAGGNFSSGADMFDLHQERAAPEWLAKMKRIGKLIQTMRELPQPIITKVRGVAYGGGANLALAGDFVLASQNARFCQVFINIGVIPDCGGFYFLPRLIGLSRARELALLGDEVDGKSAASIGLIYKSVPDEELDREVTHLARTLARKSLPAMALIKEGLEISLEMSLKEVLEWEASHQAIMLQDPGHKKAVREFLRSRGKL